MFCMKSLKHFFFGETKPEVIGFFRLALGCYLFVSFLLFIPTVLRFYGSGAPIPLFILLTLLFLLAFAAGFLTKWSTLLSYLAFLSWRNGAVFIWNGGDDVQTTLLFLMTIAGFAGHPAAAYSLDAVLLRRRGKKPRPMVPAWSLRLLQIQFCLIYFFNALQKWMQPMWRDGEAVHYAFQDLSWSNVDLSFLSHSPVLIALFSYGVLLFLTLFPAFIWYEPTRKLAISLSASFHIVTRILFNVFAFPVMVVYLVVFLKPEEVQSMMRYAFPRTFAS